MPNPAFDVPSPAAKTVLINWWRTLVIDNPTGTARAARATLRRAASLEAVACTPAYQQVYRAMLEADGGTPSWNDSRRDRLAAIVALAAHVKADNGRSLPEAMSTPPQGSDRNPVSELRFKRLLDAPDIEALFTGLRRTLPLIDHSVDLGQLVHDVYRWGDGVKKQWAYAYRWPGKATG